MNAQRKTAPKKTKKSSKTANPLDAFFATAQKSIDDKDWEKVEEACEAVLDKNPEVPEALFVLSLVAFHLDDLALAATHASRAFDLQTNVREHARLLSVYYALAGDVNNSAYYAKLVYALPENEALANLVPADFPEFSRVFQDIVETPLLRRASEALGRQAWGEAEHWFNQHLTFAPDSREAHTGLGLCLLAQGMPRPAVDALRAARHMHPHDPQIASQLGSALSSIGAFAESQACHAWAQALAADEPGIHAMAILDRLHDPNARTDDTAAAFREWGKTFAITDDEAPQYAPPGEKGTLTIGYLLGNQGGTASGFALSSILAEHDSSRFQTVGFGFGALSAVSNIVFQKCINRWHDVSNIDPLTLRAIVNAEEVDILVDVAGFSTPKLLSALGLRTAPVQVTWIESPLGTGIGNIDYLLTDNILDPDESGDGRYVEKLAYLDHGSVVAEPLLHEEAVEPRADDAELTLAADANLMEVNPRTVGIWAGIMHKVPNAKLILRDRGFKAPENAAQLISLFGDFGISHRVDVIDEPLPSRFFTMADIGLTAMPFPSAQGALEALWGGVPIITATGDGRHTRHVASLLHHLGMDGDGMIATTDAEYVDLAVAWATDPGRRKSFRDGVRDRILTAECLASAVRIKDLENLYESFWKQACEGR